MQNNLTDWDLNLLLGKDGEAGIDSEIQEMLESVKSFRQKWLDNQEYISNPEILLNAIVDYEKLVDQYFPLKSKDSKGI